MWQLLKEQPEEEHEYMNMNTRTGMCLYCAITLLLRKSVKSRCGSV